MKIKPGVILSGLDIRMRPVLQSADIIWKNHGQELTVTSGLEGTHSAGSLHYYGLAVDFRTYWWSETEALEVAQELQQALPDHLVIHEATHIHVQARLT